MRFQRRAGFARRQKCLLGNRIHASALNVMERPIVAIYTNR